MVKKSNPGDYKEIAIEKTLGHKSKTDPGFERGNAFLEEHTGSATLINLDGRWDFDHPVQPGEDPGAIPPKNKEKGIATEDAEKNT